MNDTTDDMVTHNPSRVMDVRPRTDGQLGIEYHNMKPGEVYVCRFFVEHTADEHGISAGCAFDCTQNRVNYTPAKLDDAPTWKYAGGRRPAHPHGESRHQEGPR